MDFWERLKIGSGVIAAVVIPLALAYIGNKYSSAIKERELQGRFVELATDILREEPVDQNKALRNWATKVIDEYSGVKLTDDARNELIENTSLPSPVVAISGPWVVVMGADKELASAEDELNRASNAGFASAKILRRGDWYRTVVPFTTRAEASSALEQITDLRAGSYIRHLDTWCPQPEPSTTGKYEICQP